jgi:glycosyltransferase involved in cell wall biosynthesis
MKICYIGNGTSVHIQKWAKWFADKGHDIHLITDLPWDTNDITVHLLKTRIITETNFKKFVQGLLHTREIVKKIQPDILHAHYLLAYGTVGAFSMFHPFISSVWGSDIASDPDKKLLFKKLIKHTLKKSDIIHVQDILSKKRISELNNNERKIRVLPWGVDTKIFNSNARSDEFRQKIRKKPGPIILIIMRGIETIYMNTISHAIKLVLKTNSNVNFIVLNSKQMQKLNFEEVLFIDTVPYNHMPYFMANADIFIDPYYPKEPKEIGHTYGMALLEAMASETATIAAERPTITQLQANDQWYYGHTFKRDDSKDLFEKIIQLLKNEAIRDDILQKNITSIKEKFDWNRNINRFEKEVYSKLI